MAGSTQKKANAFASSPLSKRSGYLNTPSSDSKSDFAYSGGALERFVFITPAFISIFMITFVTFWGARVACSDSCIHLLLCLLWLGQGNPLSSVLAFRGYPEMSCLSRCKLA